MTTCATGDFLYHGPTRSARLEIAGTQDPGADCLRNLCLGDQQEREHSVLSRPGNTLTQEVGG